MLNKCEVEQDTPGKVLTRCKVWRRGFKGVSLFLVILSVYLVVPTAHTDSPSSPPVHEQTRSKDQSPVHRDIRLVAQAHSENMWQRKQLSAGGGGAWSRVSHIKPSIFGPRKKRVSTSSRHAVHAALLAAGTKQAADLTGPSVPYLRPSHPASRRRKCLWQRPGAPHPHTPPRHSHSRYESHPLQNFRHRNKWTRQNEK